MLHPGVTIRAIVSSDWRKSNIIDAYHMNPFSNVFILGAAIRTADGHRMEVIGTWKEQLPRFLRVLRYAHVKHLGTHLRVDSAGLELLETSMVSPPSMRVGMEEVTVERRGLFKDSGVQECRTSNLRRNCWHLVDLKQSGPMAQRLTHL